MFNINKKTFTFELKIYDRSINTNKMKKEEAATSRVPSANFSITEIEICSILSSANFNEYVSRKLSDDEIINVKSINEKKKTLDKQSQRLAIELAENSNKLENLSVSVKSSNETLIE